MILKYKDFKTLSNDDMKQIMGGYVPTDGICTHNCPEGQTAQGCTGCHHCTDITSGNVVTGLHVCPGEGEINCLDHMCSNS